MIAGVLDITIDKGATFPLLITWSTGTPPVPRNLTGCQARMVVDPVGPGTTKTYSSQDGDITFPVIVGADPLAHKISINLSPARTLELDFTGRAKWRLFVDHLDGRTYPLLRGEAVVIA